MTTGIEGLPMPAQKTLGALCAEITRARNAGWDTVTRACEDCYGAYLQAIHDILGSQTAKLVDQDAKRLIHPKGEEDETHDHEG